MRMLLGKEVDLNVQLLGRDETLLHVATGCRHMEIIKILLETGADVNIMTTGGDTALGLVEQMHLFDLVEVLCWLDHGSKTMHWRGSRT